MSECPESASGGDAHGLAMTLDQLVRNVATLLGVPSVSVALLDVETGDLVTCAALNSGDELRRTRFRTNEGIAGWVAAHLEPALVNDVLHDARFKRTGKAQMRSMLCVPLIDADQLLGTLTVASAQVAAFDLRRQQLLQVFADQAVLAISKTRQAETAQAQARELAALLDATRALTSSLEPNQVFAYIAASTRKVIACDDVIIYAYEEHTDALRVVTGLGTRIDRLGGAHVPLNDGQSMAAWVARHRRARMSNAGHEDRGAVTEAFLAGDELALLCVPLVSKGRLRGVIMLARAHAFQPSELGAMLNLSNIVAATLENADLYQAARTEREQQAAIYAAASDAIAVVDGELTILEANAAFARLAGKPSAQLLGFVCCKALHIHDDEECVFCDAQSSLTRALQTGEPEQHIECELPNLGRGQQGRNISQPRQATKRYIDFSVTPVNSPQGRRLLLVGRDVTASREMDQMKANFLSMVSHELRSPLQTINGYLDLALSGMGGELSGQQTEFLKRARAGSEHLTALVDDLLLISRRDAGQFSLHVQDIDLTSVVAESVEELELFAEDAGVLLTKRVPGVLPHVLADGPRLAQVLRNLITNAVKFTPRGGEVTVSAEADAERVMLRVRDTGIGIATEQQERIFDRFYQVKTTAPRTRASGQGLGLAIVRIIVEQHGGSITVESERHEGSTFVVRLPRMR